MSSTPLRFVVLYHDGVAEPHFDLMFEIESGGKLASWRSANWPVRTENKLVRIADHRREYLSYEGEISHQRGNVRRVAEGTYRRIETDTHWRIEFIAPALVSMLLPLKSG
jgi:hypothetical protein